MSAPRYVKDPNAVLDYRWDWSSWLPAGDTIATATFVVDDAALVIDDSLHDTTTATAWLSGGVSGSRYVVTCHITTTDGRADDRSLIISMKDL